MMNMKKLLALLLAIVMVVGMFPMTAMAEGEEPTCATCGSTEHTEHPADPAPQNLDQTPVDNCPNCDNAECTGCDGTDSQNEEEEDKDPVCPGEGCTIEGCQNHKAPEAPVCPGEGCTIEGCQNHKAPEAPVCPGEGCTIEGCQNHKAPEAPVCPGEGCTIEGCQNHKAPEAPVCPGEGCTIEGCQNHKAPEAPVCTGDKTTCPIENCTCKQEPAILCDKCNSTEKNEDGTIKHTETCETLCTCTPVDGVHQGECIFAPVIEAEACKTCGNQECTCPKVGDKIWIKSGSRVYKNYNNVDKNYHELIGNYEVEIKHILTNDEGVVEWYQFTFIDFDLRKLGLSLGGYKYVHVENTSVEEPEEVIHEGSDTVTAEDGNSIQVEGIPENTKLQIKAADETALAMISAQLGGRTRSVPAVETVFAYDITIVDENGDEWQPGDEPVKVTLTIPDLTMGLYQKLQVAHVHEGEVKMVENVEMDLEKDTISFTTDGFSTFVGSFVDFSSDVKNSIMLTPGTAEPLMDILEAIAPETYLKYKFPDDVESVTVSSGTTGITVSKTSVTAAKDFGYDEATLTVKMYAVEGIDAKTYTIRVLRGEAIYALEGAHDNWNQAATTTKTAEASNTNKMQEVKAFDSTIYADSDYDQDDDDVLFGSNYKIYMRPGMAVTISKGISLFDIDSGKQFTDFTNDDMTMYEEFASFTWMYDGSKYNYIIAHDVAEYTVARFYIKNHTLDDAPVRTIELHIIPDNDPELLRDYLKDHPVAGYSIKEVPATLFDYDGLEWNKHYSGEYLDLKYFAFTSADGGKNADATLYGYDEKADQANTGSANANQGLVKPKLVNGLPDMAQANEVDLFSTTPITKAKTVYDNVGFEFIYDSDGYYTYNSELNHAQFNGTNKIELYTQSLSPSDSNAIGQNWADQNPKAGFYPFADINEAFHSIDAPGMSVEKKLELLNKGVDLNNRLNSDLAKDFVHSTKEGSTVGMYYGIHVHSDFYLPEGKMLNGNQMIYEFTGDDDLWVFIDGQLVLDVGGGHTPVSGSFNLTTGDVWVEKFYQLNEEAGGYYKEQKGFTSGHTYPIMVKDENGKEYDFLDSLAEDQMHTISIFYLERFSGESNCRMRFNLPLVPSESVHVSKNLVNQNNQELSVTPDVDYTFTLYTAAGSDDNIDAETFSPCAKQPYTVMGSGAPSGTQTTDANGQFTLKDGWTATFPGIPRFTEVKVVESAMDEDYEYAGHTISVNNAAAIPYTPGRESETRVIQANSSISFDFVNKMQTQPLTIEKKVVGDANGLLDPNQQFNFNLAFTKDCVSQDTLVTSGAETSLTLTDHLADGNTDTDTIYWPGSSFQLKQSESITIPRVPVNMTYVLSETDPDNTNHSFDALEMTAVISTAEGTHPAEYAFGTAYAWKMNNSGENKITVTNQQRFNLTLTKNGIDPNDIKDNDMQSVIFEVTLLDGSTMQVAVCGNGSATIVGLPVGTSYKVKELVNWPWRYELNSVAYEGVTFAEGAAAAENVSFKPNAFNAKATFTNERTQPYWLSGDCYAKNLWTDTGINATGLVTATKK